MTDNERILNPVKEYATHFGNVRLFCDGARWRVVFNIIVNPGLVYRREYGGLAYSAAITRFRKIAHIFKGTASAKCEFYHGSKIDCLCRRENCPRVIGGPGYWDFRFYDCKYRGRTR